MINAWRHTFFGAGNGIGCPRQIDSERRAAAIAQKATKRTITLPTTRTLCNWFNDTRSGRSTQSYAGMAG